MVGFWVPFAVATVAAFAPHGVPLPFRISDIVLHAFAFTYLTAALWLVHYAGRSAWTPVAWMFGYAVLIELVQSFEPQRSAEFKDIGVDMIGILLGIVMYRGLLKRFAAPVFDEDVSKHRS